MQNQLHDIALAFPVPQPRKQNTACDACRTRKVKCNQTPGQDKCQHCILKNYPCTYVVPSSIYLRMERKGANIFEYELGIMHSSRQRRRDNRAHVVALEACHQIIAPVSTRFPSLPQHPPALSQKPRATRPTQRHTPNRPCHSSWRICSPLRLTLNRHRLLAGMGILIDLEARVRRMRI